MTVSARTIRRRLQQSGLSARRPLLGLPLTQYHRHLRHQWCDERRVWMAEWNELVFTDESRICLHHHDGRIQVWRYCRERMLNSCVIHCHTGPAPGIMTARGGRVRSTTPAEDRYIVLSAKRNRRTTVQQGANQFLAASGKQISRKTVARRLRGGGLYARRPVVCVPLTRQHRTARLQWCREHHNWTEQDWASVLFSDESRFSLSSDCRRQLIWRESGTAYRPENIQEKDRYPTCNIMVWAGIMINGRTRLHVVANGTMTGQRYIDEVLLPHVRLFRGAVGDKFVFMDDNATCH
ncbi:transposable element Tcb2 transposase [Trichonephila clavipes]|uniref:Transposable element Tcb2 transposase n=1 Tax=Trichonephila clavipes TaxID=2585209 RepID=A0A8X6VJU2_TRICX|nr:transposable element Tcb2 transposase [Trichonephila clavipes]